MDTTPTGTAVPKPASKSKAVKKTPPVDAIVVTDAAADHSTSTEHGEAKTRFNAALDEAKAGAAALKDEATVRAGAYRDQARTKSENLTADAKVRAGEMAVDAKTKASGGLSSLSKVVSDKAGLIDEKLGAKYGDYARSASRSLEETAVKLDTKSVDELTEDARIAVRKSPGAAVGIAAIAGFFIARLFTGGRR